MHTLPVTRSSRLRFFLRGGWGTLNLIDLASLLEEEEEGIVGGVLLYWKSKYVSHVTTGRMRTYGCCPRIGLSHLGKKKVRTLMKDVKIILTASSVNFRFVGVFSFSFSLLGSDYEYIFFLYLKWGGCFHFYVAKLRISVRGFKTNGRICYVSL